MDDTRSVRVLLPFRPEAVREARSIVRRCGHGLTDDVVDDAELLASEVVTNAVRHGGPVIRLAVAVDDAFLTVSVSDGGESLPLVRVDSAYDEPSGRGLRMVEQVAAAWGVESGAREGGKTVWFRLTHDRDDRHETLGHEHTREDARAWN